MSGIYVFIRQLKENQNMYPAEAEMVYNQYVVIEGLLRWEKWIKIVITYGENPLKMVNEVWKG